MSSSHVHENPCSCLRCIGACRPGAKQEDDIRIWTNGYNKTARTEGTEEESQTLDITTVPTYSFPRTARDRHSRNDTRLAPSPSPCPRSKIANHRRAPLPNESVKWSLRPHIGRWRAAFPVGRDIEVHSSSVLNPAIRSYTITLLSLPPSEDTVVPSHTV